jgi:general secretion pathway protein E
MGIEPYIISAGLSCVIGQRLVRKLCPRCRVPDPKSSELIRRYRSFLPSDIKPIFWISKGCDECHSIGYKGRIGVFEVLKLSRAIQETLVSKVTITDVRRVAESEGYKMLAYDGLQKAIKGITSHKELERNVAMQNLEDLLMALPEDRDA